MDKQITMLEEMIRKFNMPRIKEKIVKKIEVGLDEVEL